VRTLQKEYAHWEPFVARLAKDPRDAQANAELAVKLGKVADSYINLLLQGGHLTFLGATFDVLGLRGTETVLRTVLGTLPHDSALYRELAPVAAFARTYRDFARAALRERGLRRPGPAELHVHPQTVRYRLTRLRELLGVALVDPAARFELALALLALAPSIYGQNRNPSRPKPQKPIEIPPAVAVLQIDTTPGDSTRTIIQRDLDFGDRIQPLILDSATLAEIWRPGEKNINFSPLSQTRANFVLRARPTATSLHVEVYDFPRGRLRQEGNFRLPKLPLNRLPAIRDSLSRILAKKRKAVGDALSTNSAARNSLARVAAKTTPAKTASQRATERRDELAHDPLGLSGQPPHPTARHGDRGARHGPQ